MTAIPNPPPDLWSLWQGKGFRADELPALFGPRDSDKGFGTTRTRGGKRIEASAATADQRRSLGFARLALQTYIADVVRRFGTIQEAGAAFPALRKTQHNRVKAVLLQADDGTFYPIATVGPSGFRFLTQEQSAQLVKGHNDPDVKGDVIIESGLTPQGGLADTKRPIKEVLTDPQNVSQAVTKGIQIISIVSLFASLKSIFWRSSE